VVPARHGPWYDGAMHHATSADGAVGARTAGSSTAAHGRPDATSTTSFGAHSEVGQLRKVMVCAPERGHRRLTPTNCDTLLVGGVRWVENAERDHVDVVSKMRDRDIDVVEMHDRRRSHSPRPRPGSSSSR
jgi:hypothetical protein